MIIAYGIYLNYRDGVSPTASGDIDDIRGGPYSTGAIYYLGSTDTDINYYRLVAIIDSQVGEKTRCRSYLKRTPCAGGAYDITYCSPLVNDMDSVGAIDYSLDYPGAESTPHIDNRLRSTPNPAGSGDIPYKGITNHWNIGIDNTGNIVGIYYEGYPVPAETPLGGSHFLGPCQPAIGAVGYQDTVAGIIPMTISYPDNAIVADGYTALTSAESVLEMGQYCISFHTYGH
jgi:hypothetical protein